MKKIEAPFSLNRTYPATKEAFLKANMSVIQPILNHFNHWNLSSVAQKARTEAFCEDTKDVALAFLETTVEKAKTMNLEQKMVASLKENKGAYGEVVLNSYNNWSFQFPLETVYGPTLEEREDNSLRLEIAANVHTSATISTGIPSQTVYVHKLLRDTQILPVLAAHIGSNVWVTTKWVRTVETLSGYIGARDAEVYATEDNRVTVAELNMYKVVAVYYPHGLKGWQRAAQKKALAFYEFMTEAEALKKAQEEREAEEEAQREAEEQAERDAEEAADREGSWEHFAQSEEAAEEARKVVRERVYLYRSACYPLSETSLSVNEGKIVWTAPNTDDGDNI